MEPTQQNSDTIAAIATPYGTGGIGIIKISGPEAFPIAQRLFSPKQPNKLKFNPSSKGRFAFKSHRLYHGWLFDPLSQAICDEVLISFMQAPHSYTRENVVEINSHSGPALLNLVLKLVLENGARLAEPGEFTRRAFLNGRIDLSQAESVADLINARNEQALKIANTHLNGEMRSRIEKIQEALLDIYSSIEALIDFPDDMDACVAIENQSQKAIHKIIIELKRLIKLSENAEFIKKGLHVSIVGRPNVGKSSLMNRLVEKNRSIVTHIPGTTRDLVNETIFMNGLPVFLEDTAGIQRSSDPIEKIGIEKSRESLKKADLILWLVDTSHGLNSEDLEIYQEIKDRNILLVPNKIDIMVDGYKQEIEKEFYGLRICYISAKNNDGIRRLKKRIVHQFNQSEHFKEDIRYAPNARQKLVLEKCVAALSKTLDEFKKNAPYEIIAFNLQKTLDRLGEITGNNVREDVLDAIFDKFCIGK